MARFISSYVFYGDLYHVSAKSNKELFEEFKSECLITFKDVYSNKYENFHDLEFSEDFPGGKWAVTYKITKNGMAHIEDDVLEEELKQGVLELQSSNIKNKQDFDKLVYENNLWYPLPELYKYFDLYNVEEMIKNDVLNDEAKKYIITNDLCTVDFKTKDTPEPNEIV